MEAEEEEAVMPFVEPAQPRKVIVARTKLLQATIEELRLQGADEAQVAPVQKSLDASLKDAKDAGGATEGRLRTEVMAEARKIAKREAALLRAAQRRKELQEEVEVAVAKLEKHGQEEERLRAKVEYSKGRYAYLVAQQAAESQPALKAAEVHRAITALREVGTSLAPEVQEHISLLSQAVAPFYVDSRTRGKEAFAEAWADSDSDIQLSEKGDGDDLDDEVEITGDMLHEEHVAKTALKEARKERSRHVLEACYGGRRSAPQVVDYFAEGIKAAIKRLVDAEGTLATARDKARQRLAKEAAERRAQRAKDEAAEADAAAARREDEEWDEVPCPPPPKWRRAEDDADGDSEQTVEEETPPLPPASATPVVVPTTPQLRRASVASSSGEGGGSAGGPRRGAEGDGDGRAGSVSAVAGAAGAAGQNMLASAGTEQRWRGHQWALEGRRGGNKRPAEEREKASAAADVASVSVAAVQRIQESLADGAVEAVQAALAVKAATSRWRRDDREEYSRPARAVSQQQRARSRSEAPARARSKSPRWRNRAAMDMS